MTNPAEAPLWRARAERAETALAAISKERNTWARQLADAHDERDTALEAARKARTANHDTEGRLLAENVRLEAQVADLEAALRRRPDENFRLAGPLRADLEDGSLDTPEG